MRQRTYLRDGIGRNGKRRYQLRALKRQATRSKSAASGGLSAARAARRRVRRAHIIRWNLLPDPRSTKCASDVSAVASLDEPTHEREQNAGVSDDHASAPGKLSQIAIG